MWNPWSTVFRGSNIFNKPIIHNGDSLALTFENGTEKTFTYNSYLDHDISMVKNLDDLYYELALDTKLTSGGSGSGNEQSLDEDTENTFSIQRPSHGTSVSGTGESAAAEIPPAATHLGGPYPDPDIVQDLLGLGGWITGYILEDEKLAIFSLPDFSNEDRNEKFHAANPTFSNATQRFIQQSLARGVEKVIIDLQGNGGGEIALAYELFKNVSPPQA